MTYLLWNKFSFPLIILLLLVQEEAFAQEQVVKDIIERLAPTLPEDFDLSGLTEKLQHYSQHPINLNHTSVEELKSLQILSPLQISNFFTHLLNNGKLLAIEELQSIDAFDLGTINDLIPFVTLDNPLQIEIPSYKQLLKRAAHTLTLRYARVLEPQKGYDQLPGSRYLGDPGKILLKYRLNDAKFFSASLVFKKEAGEEFFKGNNKYNFDFFSFSVAFNHLGRWEKLVIGDYSLQFGQGLTLWSGFAYGKGPDVTSAAKNDTGIEAYTSSNESSFFRGIASRIRITARLSLSPFISYRKLDASLSMLPDGEYGQVNINSSGLHRTSSEVRHKNNLGQLIYGGILQYTHDKWLLGATAYSSRYQHPFITGNKAYNAKGFTGKQLFNIGLHYNYTFRNIYFFGETAKSTGGGMAMINGVMASLSYRLSAVLVNRNYDTDHYSYLSQAFGETSDASNEKGWYAGINYHFHKKWSSSLYADLFRFPWLKYRADAPSGGFEAQAQLDYHPTKTFRITTRYKIKENQQNPDEVQSVSRLDKVTKHNCRLEIQWRLNKKFDFQNRFESCIYQKGSAASENGFLFCQDINYKPLSSRLSGNLRLAYFHTDSYNSRLYMYEDDVLHGFSFGMYHGKGFRSYLNLKYRLRPKLDIWLKYALFIYQDAEKTGSGLDEISGNKKSETKVQLRYQF